MSVSSHASSQCDGTPWKKSDGKSCHDLGLDSNKAVCRSGDKYAMWCDSTKTQIRTCASEQKCGGSSASSEAASCPKHIREEHKSKRKCNAYEDGYAHGKKDAEGDHRDDYGRWDDRYDKETEEYFEEGYKYGYRDNS